jgi:hypothetical protein
MRFITENPASKTPFQSPVEVLPLVVCIALVEILCEKRVKKKVNSVLVVDIKELVCGGYKPTKITGGQS